MIINESDAKLISKILGITNDIKNILLLEAIYQRKSIKKFCEKTDFPRSTVQSHLKILTENYFIEKGDTHYFLTKYGFSFLHQLRKYKDLVLPTYKKMIDVKDEINTLKQVPIEIRPHLSMKIDGNTKNILRHLETLKDYERSLEEKIQKGFESL